MYGPPPPPSPLSTESPMTQKAAAENKMHLEQFPNDDDGGSNVASGGQGGAVKIMLAKGVPS